MKFLELEPKDWEDKLGKGIRFRCPIHRNHFLVLYYENWSLTGDFKTLTIMPSINSKLSEGGCGAHFLVVGGAVYS